MKKGLIVFLALCAFAAAMVPRERSSSAAPTSTTEPPKEICAPQTPCAWSIYKPATKVVEHIITNSYCECDGKFVCQEDEDDLSVNALIHHCRSPVDSGKDAES